MLEAIRRVLLFVHMVAAKGFKGPEKIQHTMKIRNLTTLINVKVKSRSLKYTVPDKRNPQPESMRL